jgi:integrase
MSFRQITSFEVKKFVGVLNHRMGQNKGQKLSRSRIGNILIPFKALWSDACDQHQWNLPDPFRFISKHLPKRIKKSFEVLRFDEWTKIVEHFDPVYRNVVEIMIMTGMIVLRDRWVEKRRHS